MKEKMLIVCHRCKGYLVACIQTNLINYSNLGGGKLASQELKCLCRDLLQRQLWVRKKTSVSKNRDANVSLNSY